MSRWIAIAMLAGAACGDNHPGEVAADAMPDSGAAQGGAACQATLSENFAERWDGQCARMTTDDASGDGVLKLTIPSSYLGVAFDVRVDLGAAPGPGSYSSQSSARAWSVLALKEFDMTSCLYQAGAGMVPPGTYRLDLDAAGDTPHGTLEMEMYVLSRPYTYCGERSTEHLHVTF